MLIKRVIDLTTDELVEIIRVATKDAMGSVPTNDADETLLNRKDASIMLKCSTQAIDQWKKAGKLKFRTIGKRVFFTKNDILESLKAGNIKSKLEV